MSLISEVREELARQDNSPREMKKFGFTLAIALAALAALIYFFSSQPSRALWPGCLGVALLILALLFPRALRSVRLMWMACATVLGYFMSRLILTVIFFLIIVGIRIIMTIIGKDILHKSLETQKESYWIQRQNNIKPSADYEKMF